MQQARNVRHKILTKMTHFGRTFKTEYIFENIIDQILIELKGVKRLLGATLHLGKHQFKMRNKYPKTVTTATPDPSSNIKPIFTLITDEIIDVNLLNMLNLSSDEFMHPAGYNLVEVFTPQKTNQKIVWVEVYIVPEV